MKYGQKRVFITTMLAVLIMCLCQAGMASPQVFDVTIELKGASPGEVVVEYTSDPASTGDPLGIINSAYVNQYGKLAFNLPNTLLSDITIFSIKTYNLDRKTYSTYTGSATIKIGITHQEFDFTKYTPAPVNPYAVISGPSSGYTNDMNGLVIKQAGEYTVKSNYNPTTVPITITAPTGEAALTLNGVKTIIPEDTESPALWITKDCAADVTLILDSGTENVLSGGKNCAGLQKDNGDAAWLTIEGSGALNATGGQNAAGIGGGSNAAASKIRFTGGIINSEGGQNAAGIGGGARATASNIEIAGGTIRSTGRGTVAGIGGGAGASATGIVITGGSIDATIPNGTDSIPVEIDLFGAGDKRAIANADIDGLEAAYGLVDVQTMDGKLYFWLPENAILKSVTAGDKEYMDEADIEIIGPVSVKLHPPPFKAVDGEGKVIPNTYRDGLTIATSATISMAHGVDTALAPFYMEQNSDQDMNVVIDNLNVDTRDRKGVYAARFTPNASGKVTVRCKGENYFSSIYVDNAEQYSVEFMLDDGKDTRIGLDRLIGTRPAQVYSLKALKDTEFITLDVPGAYLENGSANGGGSFTIVKRGVGTSSLALNNLDMSVTGLMPARIKMNIDENSTLTLKQNAILILLEGSSITGAGRMLVDGYLVGNADVDILYRIKATAMGDWPLTQTGVTDGYAKPGDNVSIAITQEEGFLGWEIKPAIEGLDLTRSTLSFTADKAYDVRALYEVKVKGVEFAKSKHDVETGDTLKLKWALKPKDVTDRRVTFASSNPAFVEVDEDGLVYGVSSGDAVITITTIDGSFTDTCAITVVDPPVKPLDVSVAAIKLDGSMKLAAPAGYAGTWSIGDESIASIINNKKLKGVSLGETTLTFTVTQVASKRPSLVNGKALAVGESASVPLNVRKKKELVSSINLGGKTIYLAPGEEMALSPTLKPKSALDRDVVYRTGNTRIARVEGETLFGMSEGKTNLIATASSFITKKVSLIVTNKLQKLIPQTKKAEIKVGDYVQFVALTQPLGLENVPITWTSKKPGVATVDEYGVATGVKKGKATIVAKSGKKKATFTVTVK